MRRNQLTMTLAVVMVAVLGLVLAMSGPAIAGDEGEAQADKKVKIVKIKKKIDCEAEDCEHAEKRHKMIMKKHGDMDEVHVECEGDDCDEGMNIFISKDGKIEKVHVSPGHPAKWIEEDCEGDDCERQVKVIVKKVGDGEDLHSMISDEIGKECKGEDCKAKVIFIGEDGEMKKAHAMAGHQMVWKDDECEGDDCEHDVRVIVKKAGDMDEIHSIISREMDMDCEGEDCAKRVVVIGGDGAMHKTHAMAGHQMVWNSEDCEGEDCKHERRIIIRRGDGMHQVHGSGDFSWVGGDGKHMEFFGAKGGFLGIHLTDLTEELRAHFGAPTDQGVMIGKVQAESAAASAGLEVGDIVVSFDGEGIGSASALSKAVRSREGGESVEIGILRGDKAETVTAVLGESKVEAPHGMHTMMAFCGEGEDCEVEMSHFGNDYDCGGAEECKVEVECEGDDCTCTANGEAIDCKELNLPHRESKE
jgi:hypothetical protein